MSNSGFWECNSANVKLISRKWQHYLRQKSHHVSDVCLLPKTLTSPKFTIHSLHPLDRVWLSSAQGESLSVDVNQLTSVAINANNSKKVPSVSKLATTDIPAGCGRKGSVPPRKKKKLQQTRVQTSIHYHSWIVNTRKSYKRCCWDFTVYVWRKTRWTKSMWYSECDCWIGFSNIPVIECSCSKYGDDRWSAQHTPCTSTTKWVAHFSTSTSSTCQLALLLILVLILHLALGIFVSVMVVGKVMWNHLNHLLICVLSIKNGRDLGQTINKLHMKIFTITAMLLVFVTNWTLDYCLWTELVIINN